MRVLPGLPATPSPRRCRIERGARSPSHRVRSGDNPLQAEMRRIVESIYGPPVRRLPGLDDRTCVLERHQRGVPVRRRPRRRVPLRQGLTSFAMVDITGHGIHAAMHAGLAKHALRAYASRGFSARCRSRAQPACASRIARSRRTTSSSRRCSSGSSMPTPYHAVRLGRARGSVRRDIGRSDDASGDRADHRALRRR